MQAQTELSKTHICFLGKYEYFTFNSDLYRAPIANPIDFQTGLRKGGRIQAPSHLAESTLEFHKEMFQI